MKKLPNTLVLSLLLGLMPGFAHAASDGFGKASDASAKDSAKKNLIGKFYVSSVSGHVECVSDSRIYDVKKGDVFVGRGAELRTNRGSSATLVFSNETTLFVDEKTEMKVNKFEQQPFEPNNNLLIEPSNSDTLITVDTGRVVISTPQLLSGTSLIFETAHARVSILNGQPGGEKAFIEVTDNNAHFALITGAANIQVRGANGDFVSIGTRVISGEQAYVRYTLSGQITMSASSADTAVAPPSATASGSAGANAPVFSANAAVVTVPGQAVVLNLIGEATAQVGNSTSDLSVGAKLPQGATIVTSATGEVYLQAFDGAVSDIKPDSKVVIEKLADAVANGVAQKHTALLDLKKGTLVSMLDPDPAKRKIDNYGVRTPRGIATAHGTSFSVSVTDNDFSVAATADSVTFVTPSGTTYNIAAGNITITSPSGQPQAPIPLSQAVAEDPAIARVVRTAVNTVSTMVQNNIGSLSSSSAINLISQVVGVAAAAMPAQAAAFTTEVVTAVNAPGASTSAAAANATASVTSASVTAAPTQAAQLAAAAVKAVPSQANTIAGAAASAAPTQSVQVATSVLQTIVQSSGAQSITALTQAAASLASAIATSAPAQAAPVAGALMQAISQANPQATTAATTQAGATLASAVSTSVPQQAAPVAAAVMQSITQNSSTALSSTAMSQTAATLAAAVTTTVPTQAVPVATALMQFVQQTLPAAGAGASGLITAAVSSAAPSSGSDVTAAVAAASNQSVATVTQSAQAAAVQGASTAAAAAGAASSGADASRSASSANSAVAASSASTAANIAATTTSTGPAASSSGVVQGTSIIVSKLAAGNEADIANNLSGATNTVTFNQSSSNDNGGAPTVIATPTTPSNLPADDQITQTVTGTGT